MTVCGKLSFGLWIFVLIICVTLVFCISKFNLGVHLPGKRPWLANGDADSVLQVIEEKYKFETKKVDKGLSRHQESIATEVRRKKILFGNSFYGYDAWQVGLGNKPFHRLECEVRNCEFTDNLAELNTSDAVLFHIHELSKKPPKRFFPEQRWVFWMLESPGWSPNVHYKKWNGLFNWTMTYRLDSDIRMLYGDVTKKKHAFPGKTVGYREMDKQNEGSSMDGQPLRRPPKQA